MAISPINCISVKQNYNNMVNFTGRKSKDSENNLYENTSPRHSNKMATVPVIVLMAMTPGMMNGKQPIVINPENAIAMTEVVANPSDEIDMENTFNYMEAETIDTNNLPVALKRAKIHYQEDFKAEGKNYTMYFADPFSGGRTKDVVSSVYFVPEDFKPVIIEGRDKNRPPLMQKFVYHNLGDDSFVGAVISEITCDKNGNNRIVKTREIKLPNDIANTILGMILGDYEYKPLDRIAKMYIHVNTPELEKPTTSKMYQMK